VLTSGRIAKTGGCAQCVIPAVFRPPRISTQGRGRSTDLRADCSGWLTFPRSTQWRIDPALLAYRCGGSARVALWLHWLPVSPRGLTFGAPQPGDDSGRKSGGSIKGDFKIRCHGFHRSCMRKRRTSERAAWIPPPRNTSCARCSRAARHNGPVKSPPTDRNEVPQCVRAMTRCQTKSTSCGS
jgi:hypothetical protein